MGENRRKIILVIDDDEAVLMVMSAILDALGHSVVIAKTGSEGLGAVRAERPALVFCDVGLPDMSGKQVIRELKADPQTSSISVLLMSGHDQSESRETGAVGFLAKPFTLSHVQAAVGLATAPQVKTCRH